MWGLIFFAFTQPTGNGRFQSGLLFLFNCSFTEREIDKIKHSLALSLFFSALGPEVAPGAPVSCILMFRIHIFQAMKWHSSFANAAMKGQWELDRPLTENVPLGLFYKCLYLLAVPVLLFLLIMLLISDAKEKCQECLNKIFFVSL